MGLDTVELIWRIEEVFRLEVSQSAAEQLQTVGDLHKFVLDTLRARGESPEPSDIWDRLKRIFVEDHAIPTELVVPAAHVVYGLGLD